MVPAVSASWAPYTRWGPFAQLRSRGPRRDRATPEEQAGSRPLRRWEVVPRRRDPLLWEWVSLETDTPLMTMWAAGAFHRSVRAKGRSAGALIGPLASQCQSAISRAPTVRRFSVKRVFTPPSLVGQCQHQRCSPSGSLGKSGRCRGAYVRQGLLQGECSGRAG